MNASPKYVFSSMLHRADWRNSTLVRGDAAVEVTKLKNEERGNLLIFGHGLLGETLQKQKLLDALDLSIHPLFLGYGKPWQVAGAS